MRNFVSTIILEPSPGSEIKNCLIEAMEISNKFDATVQFSFNGVEMEINADKILRKYEEAYYTGING